MSELLKELLFEGLRMKVLGAEYSEEFAETIRQMARDAGIAVKVLPKPSRHDPKRILVRVELD